jgi:hypothetical protein
MRFVGILRKLKQPINPLTRYRPHHLAFFISVASHAIFPLPDPSTFASIVPSGVLSIRPFSRS